MAKNEDRRRGLTDAGLTVLSREGARGLTHRAVDREAGVPTGTTSNYFRTREALIGALVARIGERLGPTGDDLAARAGQVPDRRLFAAYMRDIVRRLTDDRDVTIALFELVSRWNQFMPVILYINDSSKYTLQVALNALVTENLGTSGMSMVTPNVRMAGIVIAILPLVVIYPFMQRYFVQGITLGSVKE